MFEYAQSAPLNVSEASSEARGEVTVKDIAYPSPVDGKPIAAYLVLPAGNGPFPAVLFAHWYEPAAATSNRTEFLDEAVGLAREGVASLLVSTMWSDPDWYTKGRTLASDYDDAVKQVVELRRGLDVLAAQPQVNAVCIAYVGHDFGAMYGSLLASTDRRPIAYVLIAGASNFNKWMLFGVDPEQAGLDAYRARMDALAPTHFVSGAAPAPLLFQFGTEDTYTPAEDYNAFFAAASTPRHLSVYSAEHSMALPEIQADRRAFLRLHLGLA
ncbi:MAG: hypothetical protein U0694_03130 [Anaerolineae bacterium]